MAQTPNFRKKVIALNMGQELFHEGDGWNGLFFVQKGLILIHKSAPGPDGPLQVELARVGPGALLGEMGLLNPGPREATARALEASEVVVIPREMVEKQMKEIPQWISGLIRVLITRLKAANAKAVSKALGT